MDRRLGSAPRSPSSRSLAILAWIAAMVLAGGKAPDAHAQAGGAVETRVVDDFQRTDGLSALGTPWRFFTDRVMGGVSRGSATRDTLDGALCLRLRGDVSLENNGGFVQMALPLDPDGERFDASAFTGIRLVVRGTGAPYFVHLRSRDTRLPWQYYAAPFAVDAGWREVLIPFDAFRPDNLSARLDPSRLERIAIVAAKQAFAADVAVRWVGFYRAAPGPARP